jgi:SAM-dependent methyltransferase
MSGSGYIHGTAPSEQRRLAGLNRLTNATFVEFLGVRPGMRVLEVGSGLGFLAAAVARAAPDVRVVGLEQSAEQLGAATKDPAVQYLQGDAHRLQFHDGSFDLVYARYVLEHVANPETVLKEMKRVTSPGGHVVACENDSSLIRFDPDCPAFESVWRAFQQHQKNLGGDSEIGRRLYGLFRKAGLNGIELSVQPEVHWYGSPGFVAWLENLMGNVESARRGLVQSGLCSGTVIDEGIMELSALSDNERGSAIFAWNRAVGAA